MNYTTSVGERGVATEETERLIASDKVEGTAVFDPSGKHLGRVHHLMIDKYTGQVVYVVASFGGFFGIGENWVPLPWRALNYEPRVASYVLMSTALNSKERRVSHRTPIRIGRTGLTTRKSSITGFPPSETGRWSGGRSI